MNVLETVKRNPVVISGVILSLLTAVYEAGVADGFTPAVIVPVILAFLTKHFTVPASEVVELEEGDVIVTAGEEIVPVELP